MFLKKLTATTQREEKFREGSSEWLKEAGCYWEFGGVIVTSCDSEAYKLQLRSIAVLQESTMKMLKIP